MCGRRNGVLFLGLVLAGTTLVMEAPIAVAEEMERVPTLLSAFVPRSHLPLTFKQMTSDEHYVGCRGLPGSCHGRCEGDELCRNLVSSDGKRYCGCPQTLHESWARHCGPFMHLSAIPLHRRMSAIGGRADMTRTGRYVR